MQGRKGYWGYLPEMFQDHSGPSGPRTSEWETRLWGKRGVCSEGQNVESRWVEGDSWRGTPDGEGGGLDMFLTWEGAECISRLCRRSRERGAFENTAEMGVGVQDGTESLFQRRWEGGQMRSSSQVQGLAWNKTKGHFSFWDLKGGKRGPDVCHPEGRKWKAILPDIFNFSVKQKQGHQQRRAGEREGSGWCLRSGKNSACGFCEDGGGLAREGWTVLHGSQLHACAVFCSPIQQSPIFRYRWKIECPDLYSVFFCTL